MEIFLTSSCVRFISGECWYRFYYYFFHYWFIGSDTWRFIAFACGEQHCQGCEEEKKFIHSDVIKLD